MNNIKPLIILDLNGVLCYKIPKDEDDVINKDNLISAEYHNIYIRPNVKKFIFWLLKEYSVAIFSSTTYKYVNIILNNIFTNNQRKQLVFLWCRDRCTLDPEFKNNLTIKKHETIKLLSSVIGNPYINSKRIYDLNNTLFLDDSPNKMRYNNKNNYYILESYHPDKKIDDINDIKIVIDMIFKLNLKM